MFCGIIADEAAQCVIIAIVSTDEAAQCVIITIVSTDEAAQLGLDSDEEDIDSYDSQEYQQREEQVFKHYLTFLIKYF